MITPSYSPTATERVLPRLALDFTTATLDPRVTVTRALNTATRINSSGLIETVDANLPRFDYSLNTGGVCNGLLIEEARTNSILYSSDISNVAWAIVYGSFTLTGSQTDPSGGTTATILTGSGGFNQLLTGLSANTTYTYSFYAKSVSGAPSYRIVTGGGTTLVARTSYSSQLNSSTFTRVSVTFTLGAADTSVRVYPLDVGSTTSVILAFHQVEAGAFATSYIPTTSTSLTRNADAVSMTGTNFSDWFNQSAGASMVNMEALTGTTGDQYGLRIAGGTNPIVFGFRETSTIVRPVISSVAGSGVTVSGSLINAVGAYDFVGNTKIGAANGVISSATSVGTVGTNTLAYIGSFNGTAGVLNGWMKKISYWPQKLTNAEVQAFSKM